MSRRFEINRDSYKEELSAYLCDNKIPIALYAETLGEDCITSILCPPDERFLSVAKRAFEIYKAINEAKKYMYFNADENLAYASMTLVIEGISNISNYHILEESFEKIFADPYLRGRIKTDALCLNENKKVVSELFSSLIKMSEGNYRMHINLVKMITENMEYLSERISQALLIKQPDVAQYFISQSKLKGIEYYNAENEDIYNYIIGEQLNISPSLRKLK